MEKKSNIFMAFFAFMFLLSIFPKESMAFSLATSGGCVPEKGSGQYTEAVVKCVKEPIQTAAIAIMKKISDTFKPVVIVLSTLAIVLFGISIMDSGGSVGPPAFMFILRLGMVSFFSYNLGGFAEKIYAILDQLLTIVTTSNYSPWKQIDLFIGELLGFAKNKELKDGIIGLINGSATVKLEGAMLSGMGLLTLFTVFGFMFEAVFVYLSSLMVIGFLIIISPLIIPFAVFNHGGQYLKQWFNLLVAALLAPVLVFAVLWIFVGDGTNSNTGIFKSFVDDIFKTMDDNGVSSKDYMEKHSYTNQSWLSLLQNVDSEEQKKLAEKKCLDDKGNKITGCKINKEVSSTNPIVKPDTESSSGEVKITGVDFGANDRAIKKALFFAILNLWIFSYIMKSMMQQIQGVASSLAGTPRFEGSTSSPLADIGITQKIGS